MFEVLRRFIKPAYAVLVLIALGMMPGEVAAAWPEENAFQVSMEVAKLVTGTEDVSSTWQTVELPHDYSQMVVVATPVYDANAMPAVVRIRNAAGNSFEVRVQNPSGQTLDGYTVHYVVAEAGVYSLEEHGVKFEAVRVTSTQTSNASSWSGEPAAFVNNYISPVVLGQVMTYNDERWSTFWSHGLTASIVPGLGVLYVGKHVGEDPNIFRGDEELGYMVFEAGTGLINGYEYEAIAGTDIVRGMEDAPPYVYGHQIGDNGLPVATIAAMDGVNGGWAVLWGDDGNENGAVQLAIDEDQTRDDERVHSTEQVHAVIFRHVQPAPELLSFTPEFGIADDEVTLYGNNFVNVTGVAFNGLAASFVVVNDQEITATVPAGATTGPIQVTTAGGISESEAEFQILKTPQIFSFDPPEGPHGTVVEIFGQNFEEVIDVSFAGWSSKSYEVVNETKIIATVPTTAGTGRIRVRNAAGMATTPEAFKVIPIFAFEDIVPNRAEATTTIRLTGFGLLEAQRIEFYGGVVADFTIVSDEEIVVTVPANGLSGPISMTMEDGTVLEGPVDFTLTFSEPLQGLNLCRLTYATVEQSSTSHAFSTAVKACDGITDGTFGAESIASTESEFEAWWETDLGGTYNISEVAIWNRGDCCQDDLSNFYILISDTPFASNSLSSALSDDDVTSYYIDEVAVFESIDVTQKGRYVRVQKQGTGSLAVSEIEVVSGEGNTSTSQEKEVVSEGSGLKSVYPSPFSSLAEIGFTLERTAEVYLGVYDVLGREVIVLEDGVVPAGSHQETLHAGDLPNGVYFVRLLIQGSMETKSVVLAR